MRAPRRSRSQTSDLFTFVYEVSGIFQGGSGAGSDTCPCPLASMRSEQKKEEADSLCQPLPQVARNDTTREPLL